MATAQETFGRVVIGPLHVNLGDRVLSYAEYLALPVSQRSNDEADVVDSRFTQKMLEWLGYDSSDFIYNRPLMGRPQDKPDFVVKMVGATAFVVEDKSTDERFNEASVKQLRRYTVGTSGYSLWTNGRVILGLRFDANGHYQTLVDVRVDQVFGPQPAVFSQEANFESLYMLFHKERFTTVAQLVQELAISEADWTTQAQPITGEASLQAFIMESRSVLDQLTVAIKARLATVTIELDESLQELVASQQRYAALVSELLNKLKGGGGVHIAELTVLEKELQALTSILTDIDITHIERLKPTMPVATLPLWSKYIQDMNAVISTQRERELARVESRRIRSAYLVWLERYKIIEGAEGGSEQEIELQRQQSFAEQVSYVFFVRLLLTRVLEDKGIMPHLVVDGGFKVWYGFMQGYGMDSLDEIGGESFLPIVYRRVASFYRHFFQQPVFDWFLPDDYLLTLVLHRLSKYTFKNVTSDLLGFTYEAFIDRVSRNKKGHFLTPPAIVEYMLDRADYHGSTIIGESLLDMACGSGSFLVHAARRLKQVLSERISDPLEVARRFIAQVQSNLVGLEVNPFSCYLAELNLFIQVLDDLRLLWQHDERPDIERFAIYNTNSLEMPQAILYSELNGTTTTFIDESAALDDAALIKARHAQFTYVISNPPYVNRGIVLETKSYGRYPFYRSVVKGDENFYLLFLRLATYYVAPAGTICFICPLNLLGDESTMVAREMLNDTAWSLRSLTRFYARDVLFPGVLQGIVILRIEQRASQPGDLVEIRGGFTLEEAEQAAVQVPHERVVANYPLKATWSKPWLVHAQASVYDFWEAMRSRAEQELADLIAEKMRVAKGDIRSTWARPMRVAYPKAGSVPLTKGGQIANWGSWLPTDYLDPTVAITHTLKDYRSSLWVQRQVQRIASLTQPETVLLLKEVSGLEMKRPIRGTILQRDAKNPVAADETVLVMYTLSPAYEQLAYALFGLLTSTTYNFLFSLFSTNAHANFKEILRLPVPSWSLEREAQLAQATRATLDAYKQLYEHEQTYGVAQSQQVAAYKVLEALKLPALRLEDLVLRGEVIIRGNPAYALDVLLNRGQIEYAASLSEQAKHSLELVLRSQGALSYNKGAKDLLVPNPRSAPSFLSQLEVIGRERMRVSQTATLAQQNIDELVMDTYEITVPTWREMVAQGVPWVSTL